MSVKQVHTKNGTIHFATKKKKSSQTLWKGGLFILINKRLLLNFFGLK